MIFSVLFRTAEKLIFWILLILSAFFLLRGHQAPGGGFIAALILYSALILKKLSQGHQETPGSMLYANFTTASGLILALVSGLFGALEDKNFMQGVWLNISGVAIGTPLLFDFAIFFTVLGALQVIFNPLFDGEVE